MEPASDRRVKVSGMKVLYFDIVKVQAIFSFCSSDAAPPNLVLYSVIIC